MAVRKPLVLVDGVPSQLPDGDELPGASEWTAETVSQAEAEAGTATTRRAWTAQRVRQAIDAVTTPMQAAIGAKQDVLVSGTNIKTINNESLLGSGNITITDVTAFGLGSAAAPVPGNNIDSNTIPTGFYYVLATTSGTKPAGDEGFGHLIVSREGGGVTARQLYLDNASARIWTRVWAPSQWSGWVEIYHSGNISSANAGTATKLQTARTITIGNTGKSFDGSADVSWSLAEIGAVRFGILANGVNLNNVVDPGFYRINAAHGNAPPGVDYGQLIVARGGDTILQIVTGYSNGEIYWRQGNPPDVGGLGSWSAWHRFFHSGNLRDTVEVISTNTTAVASRTYVLTASLTLTLPATPTVGNWVNIVNRSGTTTPIVARNGQNIMGLAEDMILDNTNATLRLVFADATRGWVLN